MLLIVFYTKRLNLWASLIWSSEALILTDITIIALLY